MSLSFPKYIFLSTCVLLLFFNTTTAQTPKGIIIESADSPSAKASSRNAYALIVGVSNYPYVKPLNFAEEDALLFFEFLRSKAGGEVPENHIKLLLNEQATHANVTAGLAWLNSSTGAQPQPGDRVYIYLSGHGDAYDASEAYYLCYDSNPAGDKNNYQLGGALNIGIMKNRLAAMVKKGIEVILVVDACRSGDVPGVRSGIGNPYQSVIEEPVGEVLLLSAGPNQFALEDRRWGGGHGGFTWYLIKGLSGEADVDGDGAVSLFEIESYTKMKLISDTKQMGAAQTPYVCCNNKFDCVLSKKDEVFSQRVRAEESGNTKVGLTALAARDALEKAMFEKDELKQAYFSLKKACRQERYLGSNSAWNIWEDCKEKYTTQEIEPLRMYLMGALAAEGQKAINKQMTTTLAEFSPGYPYYHTRRIWLETALGLAKSKDEIPSIQVNLAFIRALELSNYMYDFEKISNDSIALYTHDGLQFTNNMGAWESADQILDSLEASLSDCAVYWYLKFRHKLKTQKMSGVRPDTKWLRRAAELAPYWPRVWGALFYFDNFSVEEIQKKIDELEKKNVGQEDVSYLRYYLENYKIPLDSNSLLECVKSIYNNRPSVSNFNDFFILNTIDLLFQVESKQKISKERWVAFAQMMNDFYSKGFDPSDLVNDTLCSVRMSYLPDAIKIACYFDQPSMALSWLQIELEACPCYEIMLYKEVLIDHINKNSKNVDPLIDNPSVALNLLGNERLKLLSSYAIWSSSTESFTKDFFVDIDKMDFADTFTLDSLSRDYARAAFFQAESTDEKSYFIYYYGVKYLNRDTLINELIRNASDIKNAPLLQGDEAVLLSDLNLIDQIKDSSSQKLIEVFPENRFIKMAILLGQLNNQMTESTKDSLLLGVNGILEEEDLLIDILSCSQLTQLLYPTPSFQAWMKQQESEKQKLELLRLLMKWKRWDEVERVFQSLDWKGIKRWTQEAFELLDYFIEETLTIENEALLLKLLQVLTPAIWDYHLYEGHEARNVLFRFYVYGYPQKKALFQMQEFKQLKSKFVKQ